MKKFVLSTAVAIAVCVTALGAFLWSIFHNHYPPQPKFGFTGNWRSTDALGFKERPLPPAANVWRDYESWTVPTNYHGRRLYLARLGGSTNQTAFRSSISSGDTPMGAQKYTNVEFVYTDLTNGTYILSWDLRGEHDPGFLRFNDTFRLYQLEPYGTPGEYPPKLSIHAIEGLQPEH